MADLLPSEPDVDPAEEPRIIGIDSEEADDLLSVLTSDTARRILSHLHEEPTTPARLADAVDTSLQNVQYHLRRLESAGVIEVADTAYSEKGREMNVYAPADRALVVVAGEQGQTTGLKTALSRLLGGVGVLGIASVVLDRLLRRTGGYVLQSGGADGGEAGDGGGAGGSALTAEGDAGAAAPPGNATATPTATPGADGGAAPTTAANDSGGFNVADVTPEPSPTATPSEATETLKEATAVPTPTPAPTQTPAATAAPTQTPAPTPVPTTTEPVTTAVDGARTVLDAAGPDTVTQVFAGSPGLLFFLGGTTVLLAWFAFWALRR